MTERDVKHISDVHQHVVNTLIFELYFQTKCADYGSVEIAREMTMDRIKEIVDKVSLSSVKFVLSDQDQSFLLHLYNDKVKRLSEEYESR